MEIPPGLPKVSDYLKLLNDDLFLQMELFSNSFLKINHKILKKYHLIKDPLHQWSRQWEYPFCYSCIEEYLKNIDYNRRGNILDGGSGFTFFPYYVHHKFLNTKVYCCDMDDRLTNFFLRGNKNMNKNINFKVCNLLKTEYEDSFFDIAYCISVLEHTTDYGVIIKEFKRVIKPDGLLIITFDISLDKRTSIHVGVAQDLLQKLNNEFQILGFYEKIELSKLLRETDILTTDFFRKFNKKLLPWKIGWKTILRKLMRLKTPKKPFWNLTVFCGAWRNER